MESLDICVSVYEFNALEKEEILFGVKDMWTLGTQMEANRIGIYFLSEEDRDNADALIQSLYQPIRGGNSIARAWKEKKENRQLQKKK